MIMRAGRLRHPLWSHSGMTAHFLLQRGGDPFYFLIELSLQVVPGWPCEAAGAVAVDVAVGVDEIGKPVSVTIVTTLDSEDILGNGGAIVI